MSKHTPGPWQWDQDGWPIARTYGSAHFNEDDEDCPIPKYAGLALKGSDGNDIIPLYFDHYEVIYEGDPITEANANLIAAAPDLLEAAKLAQALMSAGPALEFIKIAIAKAEPLTIKEIE